MSRPSFSSPLELLQALVAIPSVNPAHVGDPAHKGEGRMAAFLSDYLSSRGFRVEQIGDDPTRPNVVARFGPSDPVRTIVIEGHTDTVSVAEMIIDPFAGEVRDGRVYGRGTSDMKGPMAAALWALSPERLEAAARAGVETVFVGAIDEECGTRGAQWLVDNGFRADEILVLEPTGNHPVVAHKGLAWLTLTVTGKSGHGARPETGINAIEAMAEAIGLLRRWSQARNGTKNHALLGPPTMSIGRIEGGTAPNIIPDSCRVQIDFRTIPGDDIHQMAAEIRAELSTLVESGRALAVVLDVPDHVSRPVEFPVDSALVRRLCSAALRAGHTAVPTGAPWFSDAGPLSGAAPACAVFGPGHIEQAHTRDEFIAISDFMLGVAILEQFVESFGTVP